MTEVPCPACFGPAKQVLYCAGCAKRAATPPVVSTEARERGLVGVYVGGRLVWEGERQADAFYLKHQLETVLASFWPSALEAKP